MKAEDKIYAALAELLQEEFMHLGPEIICCRDDGDKACKIKIECNEAPGLIVFYVNCPNLLTRKRTLGPLKDFFREEIKEYIAETARIEAEEDGLLEDSV